MRLLEPFGCTRIVVQPEEIKDHKPADNFVVDEPQLTILEKGVIKGFNQQSELEPEPQQTQQTQQKKKKPPHGNRDDSTAISRM